MLIGPGNKCLPLQHMILDDQLFIDLFIHLGVVIYGYGVIFIVTNLQNMCVMLLKWLIWKFIGSLI